MALKCKYCDYESIYPQNLKRHIKSHLKSLKSPNEITNEIGEIIPKSLKSPNEITNEISEITPKSVKSAMKSGKISEITPKSVKSMIPEPEYQTVQTAVDEIVPIPDKESQISKDIAIIGKTADSIAKQSRKVIKKYKPVVESDTDKANTKSHALAISLVAIILTFAIAWFLFKDQIMDFVGKFSGDSGSLVMGFSPDGTKVYR